LERIIFKLKKFKKKKPSLIWVASELIESISKKEEKRPESTE
jgi:hypothetical protein